MKAYFSLVLTAIFYLSVVGMISSCGQKGDLVQPQPPEKLSTHDDNEKQPQQNQ